MNDIPRRIRMDLWSDGERVIQQAVDAVEAMGADVRLTDAVVLLARARERVADFIDGVPGQPFEADNARLRQQVERVVGKIQTLQPAGSPPPGGAEVLVDWIVRSVAAQVEQLREALTAQPCACFRDGGGYVERCDRCRTLSTPPDQWLAEHDRQQRIAIASEVEQYAAGIDERAYPDAVAAVLRFRGLLLRGRSEFGAQTEPPSAGVSSTNSGQADQPENRQEIE